MSWWVTESAPLMASLEPNDARRGLMAVTEEPQSVKVISHSGYKIKAAALLQPTTKYLCALVGEVTSGSC